MRLPSVPFPPVPLQVDYLGKKYDERFKQSAPGIASRLAYEDSVLRDLQERRAAAHKTLAEEMTRTGKEDEDEVEALQVGRGGQGVRAGERVRG